MSSSGVVLYWGNLGSSLLLVKEHLPATDPTIAPDITIGRTPLVALNIMPLIVPAATLLKASCLPRVYPIVLLIPLYINATTPAEFPRNGPRRVTAFSTEFSRNLGGAVGGNRFNPSAKPHAPPIDKAAKNEEPPGKSAPGEVMNEPTSFGDTVLKETPGVFASLRSCDEGIDAVCDLLPVKTSQTPIFAPSVLERGVSSVAEMMAGDTTSKPGLLTEAELRDLARHVKQHIPTSTEHEDETTKLLHLFDRVLSVSSVSSTSVVHRVAAWNALCALTDQILASSNAHVRDLLWTRDLWARVLRLCLQQSHNARPKSSKQLLSSLTDVLRRSKDDRRAALAVQSLCDELVLGLCATDLQSDSKAKLLLLKHLLSKDIVSLQDLEKSYTHVIGSAKSDLPFSDHVETLLFRTLQWASRGDLGSLVAQLLTVMLDRAEGISPAEPTKGASWVVTASGPIWAGPLSLALGCDPDNTLPYEAHIFPVLVNRSLADFVAFLQTLGLHSSEVGAQRFESGNVNEELLYSALKSGKALGLVEIVDDSATTVTSERVHLPLSFVADLASSDSRSARKAGLSLLITSHSVTRPLTASTLNCLRRTLPHMHSDTDAEYRSGLYSAVQQLLDRLRASSAVCARDTGRSFAQHGIVRTLQYSQSFLKWYLRFLIGELRPTASYQSHISALKCLLMLLRSGIDSAVGTEHWSKSAMGNTRWPYHLKMILKGIERMLLDLLMDSFDDVRQAAAAILEIHYATEGSAEMLSIALPRATKMMLTSGRADHADGVALMHALDSMLATRDRTGLGPMARLLAMAEDNLETASEDLNRAINRYPLHGILTSLRYVLLRHPAAVKEEACAERLNRVLQSVWKLVAPTLCEDAPEGHTTDESDETPDLSSKALLSYCWRALKEASLLMSAMLSSTPRPPSMICHELQHLCLIQLATLRHRGAFSTVAQTWTVCCSLTGTQDDDANRTGWYQRVMTVLQASHTINTRRSAGLPSLLCGVLASDPSDRLLKIAVSDLDIIARRPLKPDSLQEGSLVQVHAMNCMKDVIKHTNMAEQSERHVPTALLLAADSIQSPAWAIRNCGLMLFRAVIDRLLGTNDAYINDTTSSSRLLDFGKHTDLLDLIMGLLRFDDEKAKTGRTEGVFPALQLLQRARVPVERQVEVRDAVLALTRDASWHIRDKAARTYVSLIGADGRIDALRALLEAPFAGYNALHGRLLCAKFLLRKLHAEVRSSIRSNATSQAYKEVWQSLEMVVRTANSGLGRGCPFTQAAIAELLSQCGELWPLMVSHTDDAAIAKPATSSAVSSAGVAELGLLPLQEAVVRFNNATDADQWLEARAAFLHSHVISGYRDLDEPLSVTSEWFGACHSALRDDSIYSREAVVAGLDKLHQLWSTLWHLDAAQPLLRSLCFLVYDLLYDDDEDIRISAAETAVTILRICGEHSGRHGLVPLVAGQRLVRAMVKIWPTSQDLANVAVFRAFGVDDHGATSVASQLQRALGQSTDLFAKEKQNLYIDKAREVRVWSRVLMQTVPSAMPRALLKNLYLWVTEGLDVLTAHLKQHGDGPLGRSSKSEVFCLGLQVMYGAEVLLHQAERGARLFVAPSQLRKWLVEMLAMGESSVMNCLWMTELQKIAERAVLARMQGVAALVQSVQLSISVP
nr:hypothetical protein B0A51_09535 [Rachicladosporium sp. CCFEE 5018]